MVYRLFSSIGFIPDKPDDEITFHYTQTAVNSCRGQQFVLCHTASILRRMTHRLAVHGLHGFAVVVQAAMHVGRVLSIEPAQTDVERKGRVRSTPQRTV